MKKRRVWKKILISVLAVVLFFGAAASAWLIADTICENYARILPSYEKEDLSALIEKESWTEEDYDTIWRQTGLAKAGADSIPKESLPLYQDAFFYRGEICHSGSNPFYYHYDYLQEPQSGNRHYLPTVPLEAGDVLITSSTHIFGWRQGHAAMVVDGKSGTILQSITLGLNSALYDNGVSYFKGASNFMVLRLRAPKEERAEIAAHAAAELTGIPYNLFVGFFFPKDQCGEGRTPGATHCSHLVWQAYFNAGYDIDCNGGPLCQPRDIANSPLFEIVQINGFDLDALWK